MRLRVRVAMAIMAVAAGLTACAEQTNVNFVQPEGPLRSVQDAVECAPVVDRQVAELGLTDVQSISLVEDRLNPTRRDFDDIRGVTAWINLNSCTGYIVINMRPTCRIKEIYTRGDCTLPVADPG